MTQKALVVVTVTVVYESFAYQPADTFTIETENPYDLKLDVKRYLNQLREKYRVEKL